MAGWASNVSWDGKSTTASSGKDAPRPNGEPLPTQLQRLPDLCRSLSLTLLRSTSPARKSFYRRSWIFSTGKSSAADIQKTGPESCPLICSMDSLQRLPALHSRSYSIPIADCFTPLSSSSTVLKTEYYSKACPRKTAASTTPSSKVSLASWNLNCYIWYKFVSTDELVSKLNDYLFYNNHRIKENLHGLSPVDFKYKYAIY